jgi:BRCT domain type II-containing protein
MNIVMTGDSALISRENMEKLIKENGGKVTGGVSGKTTFLIACGDEAKAGFGQNSGITKSITETGKYK